MNALNRFFEFSLICMLASGFFAILGTGVLNLPAALIGVTALLLRIATLVTGIAWQIPNRVVTAATLAYMAFFFVDYNWLSREFLPATIHLVIFLAIVKLFTARTSRDYGYLYLIAFLEIIAASIISVNVAFFGALALFLMFAVGTFASAEIRRSAALSGTAARARPRIGWRLGGMVVSITGGVLLLSCAMFFLLPRTARAMFQHLIPERYHIAGFSNEVTLGRIGEIKKESTPVMHVRVSSGNGEIPPLHWRGTALREFDGKRWFNRGEPSAALRPERGLVRLAENEQRWRSGRRIAYEVHLQTLASDTLFIAGTPEFLQINTPLVLRTPSGTLRTGFNTQNGIRYGVYSFLEEHGSSRAIAERLSTESRIEHLILPPTDTRVIELARTLGTPEAMESYLKKNFRYTLDLPKTPPADPIAYFLFERKAGHCEYFASAMAVMLRTVGIPARVVTGFMGGVLNPISGWYVVRASDAHSWIEAWVPGRGWERFDPTPPDPNAPLMSWRDRAALWADAMETFWQDWVLGYNRDQQVNLAARIEQTRFRFSMDWVPAVGERASRIAPWILAAAALAFLLWKLQLPSLLRRKPVPESARLYQEMLSTLRRRGVEKPSWLTPREFVEQLPETPWRDSVARITDAYYRMRFAGQLDAAAEIRTLLRQL